jgi:hypothetical protein
MPRNNKDKIMSGTPRLYPWGKSSVVTTAARFQHLFQSAGSPVAGAYSSFAAAALATQQVVGGTSPSIAGGYLSPTNPSTPNKNYLTRQHLRNLTANGHGTLYLLDWLVCYRGFDANTGSAQNTTGAISASGEDARPRTYSDRSIIFADVSTTLGVTTRDLTVTYTSTKSGTPGGRSTGAHALTASAVAGNVPHLFGFLPLQADDPGVASIQTAQLSGAMGAGVFSINIANILAQITMGTSAIGEDRDYVEEAHLVEIPTDAALTWLWLPTVGVTNNMQGNLVITEGDLEAA